MITTSMTHKELIKRLDGKLNYERLEIISDELEKLDVSYQKHEYKSGTNLIVDLGTGRRRIGISSHFDRVQSSAGANDNGSAIAVCLDLIRKYRSYRNSNINLRIFFFDEEETGLKGSAAYTKERGIKDLIGLINMELVGLGDKFALWPVTATAKGPVLNTFEKVSAQKKIYCMRFDRIVTNTADHVSFRKAGLTDSFTVTRISDKDIDVSNHYFKALEFNVDKETLVEILTAAPIFKHYHRPTDTYDKLNEESMRITSETIWETILALHG
jgi:Zn-dependent M28 family amino/carboxypeptidase